MTAVEADPPRFFSRASLAWVWRHRAFTPWYLVRYLRFFRMRWRNPGVSTRGMVFLGRKVEVYARPGFGRIELGRWVHLGDGTALRAHEGTMRIGDKCVFGSDNTLNCYLDIEVGAASLLADDIYICDFDHVHADPGVPIKDQGIVKAPVRIGPGCWLGVRTTVLRGAVAGRGCVLAAHAVLREAIGDYTVAAGIPARVVADRRARWEAGRAQREDVADMARNQAAPTSAPDQSAPTSAPGSGAVAE